MPRWESECLQSEERQSQRQELMRRGSWHKATERMASLAGRVDSVTAAVVYLEAARTAVEPQEMLHSAAASTAAEALDTVVEVVVAPFCLLSLSSISFTERAQSPPSFTSPDPCANKTSRGIHTC